MSAPASPPLTERISPWLLSALSVSSTMAAVSVMSIAFHGRVTADNLLAGLVAALVVSVIVRRLGTVLHIARQLPGQPDVDPPPDFNPDSSAQPDWDVPEDPHGSGEMLQPTIPTDPMIRVPPTTEPFDPRPGTPPYPALVDFDAGTADPVLADIVLEPAPVSRPSETPGAQSPSGALEARTDTPPPTESKLTDQLLVRLSHGLRTRLNGIVGMLELLRDTALSGEQTEYLESVRHSADALLNVVGDIVDLSRIEASKLEIRHHPFDLPRLVTQIVRQRRPDAERRSIEIVRKLDDLAPRWVVGDEARLSQVLGNLIDNAIKFTHVGSVTVRYQRVRLGDEALLRFSVSDTGIGISPHQVDQIFHRGESIIARETNGRRLAGMGLGLVLCNQLVGLMGGDLSLESEPGEGSTFSFCLELPPAQVAQTQPEPTSVQPPSNDPLAPAVDATAGPAIGPSAAGAPIRVLVAEDDPDSQRVVRRMLEAMGCAVEIATNGREAAAQFSPSRHDLVLMDCHMPEVDGHQAATRIRRQLAARPGRHIPIIALTANVIPGTRERCLEAGMDDYLTKPIRLGVLREAVYKWTRAGASTWPEP